MGGTGETVTYAAFEQRTNRLAHFLRGEGLKRLDHYSIFMENNCRYLECDGAGERSGLYYTCINSYLTGDELAYIVDNSESRVFITSLSKMPVARAALDQCPRVQRCLVVDGGDSVRSLADDRFIDFDDAVSKYPETPIADESFGAAMLYSSGTTGRPKGILRPLHEHAPAESLAVHRFLDGVYRCAEAMVFLSPAPLYHAAPTANAALTIRNGGTVVIMERFDPEQFLALVERYRVTHSQVVPTMLSRLLKLPDAVKRQYDVSSLRFLLHGAAPCPPQVKEKMIDWLGPIVHEYYGATEGMGFAACDSEEWLAHRGTVGKVLLGELYVLGEAMQPLPRGVPGELWFKTANPFTYFKDPERTQVSRSPDGTMTTVGDVGYVDDDGYLYLTDRSSFMIISGGVNIYPQECENLLITHPDVADAAVFGVPNDDLGEEVKAVVQPMPGVEGSGAFAQLLLSFCRQHLAPMKCPRSVDFTAELPRLPTGKLYKRSLRDRYWKDRDRLVT